jgi:hypothetical protein
MKYADTRTGMAFIYRVQLKGADKFSARVPHTNARKTVLINMCPEIINFQITAERMLYMHDGAPAHFSRAMRDVLNNTDHDGWIGRGGPTAWPPRSSDLKRLDLYLWGHLITLV